MFPLIELKSVYKQYGEKSLIDNVSFSVNKNSLTTLIGPNGAGKTTIARLILGLEKPSSGEIIITPNLKISYVPQKSDFSSNLPLDTRSFLKLLAPDFKEQNLLDFYNFIDYENIKYKDISKLSGGQFQKLLLITALLNNPDLLIMDEPTQSLDVSSQSEFYNLIDHLRQELKLTIFMISHDLYTVMKNSDQVVCLNGHICCSGKPEDLNKDRLFLETLSSLGFYSHHHDHKH